ncbi:NO-inducible flavohemoprotein [Hahella aquimaris]|uniref:NO-inducible flavohemoprotein n=1 Tax=Hahella sp. HNIBRBA332 TaxID=3015983 RepID=UPI00273B6922|nr:NO-inducible flavohemoprotein [Hahella sp. HNIBRBA332]WLQ11879.1 NO-inducible flavohemoprotein [Hahella sp. HNIBRBA332]
MLDSNTIATIKATIPVLESGGVAITEHFYRRLFSHNPELLNIFNSSHQHSGGQQVALFNAIAAYAKHIETPEALQSAVERIAHKHTSFNIQPAQYDIVGHHLLETLQELLGDAFTPEIREAWTKAYQFLAGIFIAKEGALYEARATAHGGWKGTRTFIVQSKQKESELVTSFVLAPKDGGAVIGFQPGQYIGVKVKPTADGYEQIRQYSLSAAPNGTTYRISVKRESGEQPGLVSNYLHDHVQEGDALELMAPAGDFVLHEERSRPTVLISAGVGLTPMMSMLERLSAADDNAPIHYLHACENGAQHSFKQRLNDLQNQRKNLSAYVWYREPRSEDQPSQDYHAQGLMDIPSVAETLPLAQARFYLCGPAPFMAMAKQQLLSCGVDAERIHYEVFGPHSDL